MSVESLCNRPSCGCGARSSDQNCSSPVRAFTPHSIVSAMSLSNCTRSMMDMFFVVPLDSDAAAAAAAAAADAAVFATASMGVARS